jgi:hypothetical protein
MDKPSNLHSVDHDRNPPADVVDVDGGTAFSRMPLNLQVPIEKLRACRDPGEAFRLACIASGLDDKEIYLPLGIDPGYFTNIKYGKATLKADKEPMFCKIVGNHIYPEWRAQQLGCTLSPIDAVHGNDRIPALEHKIDMLLALLQKKGCL